ncbi:hypothetical protein [Streptomyces sp. NBC_00576]|nr:hypothetical protein [Streptomyces sp. NBC_00576]WUB71605.1 hypothetical protein OG734_16695 [Streptomyces sp. NBC_00576]
MNRDGGAGAEGQGRVYGMSMGGGSVSVRAGGVSAAVGDDDSTWRRKGAA